VQFEFQETEMSRNFEVLQKAGWRQGHFDTQDQEDHAPRQSRPVEVEAKRYAAQVEVVRDEAAKLVERVFLNPGLRAPRMVVFCGVSDGADSSWICARASKILAAQVNERVCAVDANIQTPALHAHLGGGNFAGWTDALRESRSLAAAASQVKGSNLWLLPAGKPGPISRDFKAANRLGTSVAELRAEFGYVLVDSAPVTADSYATEFGQEADGLILVMESSGTSPQVALKAKQDVEARGIPLLGIILNQSSDPFPNFLRRLLK
jgi:Mrp family chromosome partitioning ATPase